MNPTFITYLIYRIRRRSLLRAAPPPVVPDGRTAAR